MIHMQTQETDTLAHDLFKGLEINMKLSQDILDVIDKEGEALKKMDTQSLYRLTNQKEHLLAKIQYLDKSLHGIVDELTGDSIKEPEVQYGSSQIPLSGRLSALDKTLDSDKIEQIARYKKKVNTLREKIQKRSFINKRFTEDTLGYINDAISLITETAVGNKTYGARGKTYAQGQVNPTVISKEV